MELSEIIPHIEALIFASDRPLTNLDLVDLINNAFGFMEERITLDQIETALEGIREKYNSDFYPFEVFQSGGGWQFLSKPAYHTTIAQLNGGKFLKKLSNAAMETLAIIAYKQPITKGEIESIRGVNSDYSVQKLLEKELVVISGRNEELPGKPLLYETSKSFMDYFGLNSTEDLPKIKEVLAEQIEGTQQDRNVEENEDFGIFRNFDEPREAAPASEAQASTEQGSSEAVDDSSDSEAASDETKTTTPDDAQELPTEDSDGPVEEAPEALQSGSDLNDDADLADLTLEEEQTAAAENEKPEADQQEDVDEQATAEHEEAEDDEQQQAADD